MSVSVILLEVDIDIRAMGSMEYAFLSHRRWYLMTNSFLPADPQTKY
uniref:Uncharacterized protein n=1 Tax=Photobacterium damselae subsp. damselae TaxID=85581 RepID=E4WL65_PHODD|nr:hypothetical protein [Photobacterium damselae subsp. damselae]